MRAKWIPPAGALPVVFTGTCPRCGRPGRQLSWHRLGAEWQVVVARCVDPVDCSKARYRKAERAKRLAASLADVM